jgi:hypothetical protein
MGKKNFLKIRVRWENAADLLIEDTWRNLENNTLSSLHYMLQHWLVSVCMGGGEYCFTLPPPTGWFCNNSCKDDIRLFSSMYSVNREKINQQREDRRRGQVGNPPRHLQEIDSKDSLLEGNRISSLREKIDQNRAQNNEKAVILE